ncbi:hypothetical protein ABZZ74_53845 [Streptomyces sp. NPDC006476]|uniref:hypothetical protein n=1 Tax=Streptomyces sp. NPDC006476 TaxID=3157175 RepID=UPI0033A513D1
MKSTGSGAYNNDNRASGNRSEWGRTPELPGAGLVKAGGKQRTDSTHVISAVRDLNRTELAGESVRAALEALAVAAPCWLAGVIDVAEFADATGRASMAGRCRRRRPSGIGSP